MNFDVLQYFSCVAQEENVTKAAKELHISQPALSGIIASIEKELDTKLFLRRGHKITLTPAGKVYLDYAEKIFAIYQEGIKKFRDKENPKGILRINIGSNSDSSIMILSEFHHRYPDIRLQVYSQQFSIDGDKNYKIDFRIIPRTEVGGMMYTKIATGSQLYAVMREDHPLAKNKIFDLRNLENERFVFAIEEEGNLEPVYQYCLNGGLKPDITFYYDSMQYQMETVLHTGAIAITYNTFKGFRKGMGGIVSIPVNYKGNISDEIVLAWNPDNPNPLVPIFIECAKEVWRKRRNN